MYIGRFIVVGPETAAYRVSSRSFPNRKIVERDDGTHTVVPTADAAETDNPYVSYNCLRTEGDTTILGNGSHVDPIAEKLSLGYPARDALAHGLLALDFERDDYETPRIAGTLTGGRAFVGIVRSDALLVEEVEAPTLVATYEHDEPLASPFGFESATGAAATAYDAAFEHPVCAVGIQRAGRSVETAIVNEL